MINACITCQYRASEILKIIPINTKLIIVKKQIIEKDNQFVNALNVGSAYVIVVVYLY